MGVMRTLCRKKKSLFLLALLLLITIITFLATSHSNANKSRSRPPQMKLSGSPGTAKKYPFTINTAFTTTYPRTTSAIQSTTNTNAITETFSLPDLFKREFSFHSSDEKLSSNLYEKIDSFLQVDEKNIFFLPSNIGTVYECSWYEERLKHYCHQSILDLHTYEKGLEGGLVVEGEEELSLAQVHVVVRHGDRVQSSGLIVGYSEVSPECGLTESRYAQMRGHSGWAGLNDFPPLVPLQGIVYRNDTHLHPGMTPTPCKRADLTSLGFQQLFNLGLLLQDSYPGLINPDNIQDEVFAQATDTKRTIRSAGAFLLGFLPDVRNVREAVSIHVSPGDRNQSPLPNRKMVQKGCRGLHSFVMEYQKNFGYRAEEQRLVWMQQKVINMFNLKIPQYEPMWNSWLDSVRISGCQGLYNQKLNSSNAKTDKNLLPCTKDKRCLDCSFGGKMFDFSNWRWANRYPSNAAYLSALPFLHHSVIQPMDSIVTPDGSNQYQFLLTITHDTALLVFLQGLGLKVSEVIPYASRLVFELWKTTDESKPLRYYVRVLLNGEVITPRLPFSHSRELVDYGVWRRSVLSEQRRTALAPLCTPQ